MIRGSCHCGAVRFELAKTPESLTACNCSVCHRLGALWAYGDASEIRLLCHPDATFAYAWGDRTLAFHSCRTCGCTTHWQSLQPERSTRMAVNFRLAEPQAIAKLRIRHFDGADSWTYLD
jgi:hypothetical protein